MGGDDEPGGVGGGPGGSSLPVSRSFVVQLTADMVPASGGFRGRVEHIESGRSRRFASLEDLGAFLTEVLDANQSGEDV